jgi:hypothetical protein
MSYEQWLRNRNLAGEAEKWRQRKNKRILLLEMPDDAIGKESLDYSGLSDFSMSVTRQGVKFVSRGNPEAVAFIDVGRVIKVYDQKDVSLLAALQLAQQKWGGVQVNGTDEYKRRCAEIAARNGIKVVNPELRTIIEVPSEKISEPVRMAPDEARKYRENWINKTVKPRIEQYKCEMAGKLKSLRDTEKAAVSSFEEIKRREPEEGLFDALPILRQKHDDKLKNWRRELCKVENVIESTRKDIRNHPHNFEAGQERIISGAAKEFDSLHPSIAAVIRDDAIRLEHEKQEREVKEKESRKKFYASIRELAANFGKQASIITSAQDGRNYSGLMLGVTETNGHYYAVHYIGDGHVILHSTDKEELSSISAVTGKKVEISCRNYKIGEIREESRWLEHSRGWSR